LTKPLAAIALLLAAIRAAAEPVPRITIIIDDLGNRASDAPRIASLPGPVACAVLPDTPYAEAVARACHDAGKDVLVHLPMQGTDPTVELGPAGLAIGQGKHDLARNLEAALARVPHAVGVNNHMGSALTPRVAYMHWLMRGLAERGLWFLDSYTSAASVAVVSARLAGVPALRRDVFLDNERSAGAIAAQWRRLLRIANAEGHAVAIGHPHEDTLAVLEALLPALPTQGFALVSPTDMIGETPAGDDRWREYSSR